MTISVNPNEIKTSRAQIDKDAVKAGRTLPNNFHKAVVTSTCVLRPGDKLTDDRVIDETGSMVTCVLHFAWEVWKQHGGKDELIPLLCRDDHCTFLQPEERIFVTPEAIENTCVVGSPEEIISRIQSLADAGIDEVVFLPPADYQRNVFRDLAEPVILAFR